MTSTIETSSVDRTACPTWCQVAAHQGGRVEHQGEDYSRTGEFAVEMTSVEWPADPEQAPARFAEVARGGQTLCDTLAPRQLRDLALLLLTTAEQLEATRVDQGDTDEEQR